MSRVTVRIKGLDQAKANIQQVLQNVEDGSERALDVTAVATLADDQANCPIATGNLRSKQKIIKPARFTRQVGSDDVDYAVYVHEGTRYMAGRPYLTNAFEADKQMLPDECSKIQVL